jgi:hypothetical protein
MKSLKKLPFMLAFHGIDYLSSNLLRDHYHRSSFIAKCSVGVPEKKFASINKLFGIREALLGWLSTFRAAPHAENRQASDQEYTTAMPRHFPGQEINAKANIKPDTEWIPLIKASLAVKSDAGQELTRMLNNNHSLAGRTVLCVGGRAALYPDYLRLVETAGGSFISYRGSPENSRSRLYALLDRVNMVICPVDCVSHDDYFAVKRYCKLSGKFCAFLERSSLPAFTQGLAMLILQLHGDHHLE